MNFDKFGYYVANNYKTYSKVEAIEVDKNIDRVNWVFNDAEFSLHNWLIEPSGDINSFYDNRAKQIRNDYDYVVLFYSGGYDSHNILKTFIDNNLHIDEIITNIPALNIKSTPSIEYDLFTKKRLEKYKSKLPHTKIRLIEHRDTLLGVLDGEADLLYKLNHRFTINHLVKNTFKTSIEDHKKNIEKGKKVVYLFGIDKPAIRFSNDKYFSVFNDREVANVVLPSIQRNKNSEVNYEFFYWSPDCVELLIKQAHIMKRYWRLKYRLQNLNTKFIDFNINDTMANLFTYPRCIDDSDIGYFNEKSYREIYRAINLSKNIHDIMGIGGRDSWIHDLNHELVSKTYSSARYLQQKFPDAFIGGDITKPLKTLTTQYCLGK